VAAFCRALEIAPPGELPALAAGEMLVFDPAQASASVLHTIPGNTDRQRQSRKYAEGRLGEDTSFYFRGPDARLNLRAHNLMMFLDLADGVDEVTWEWHRRRGDYSQWLRNSVKDAVLAAEVATIEQSGGDPAEARREIRAAIERRYTAPG
jgi:hypothetical protein